MTMISEEDELFLKNREAFPCFAPSNHQLKTLTWTIKIRSSDSVLFYISHSVSSRFQNSSLRDQKHLWQHQHLSLVCTYCISATCRVLEVAICTCVIWNDTLLPAVLHDLVESITDGLPFHFLMLIITPRDFLALNPASRQSCSASYAAVPHNSNSMG